MSNNQWQLRTTADTTRRAFTLVELLVVGAIIVILIALTLFVMSRVANMTKETKTRATIKKLDVAMQQIFGTYEREFAFIKRQVAEDFPDTNFPNPSVAEATRQKIVAHFIRDLMRMEMPQSWAEVYDSRNLGNPLGPISITLPGVPGSISVGESPLLGYYWEAYKRVTDEGNTPGRAALLFLIIQNLNPEALEAFHGSEVADTDGDGLLEFVDAWGRPIQFLRWAPAFTGSDLQQDVVRMAGGLPRPSPGVDSPRKYNEERWWRGWDPASEQRPRLLRAMQRASVDHSDPMDERVNIVEGVIGWFLYPLIYSAGPDGRYGLAVETIDENTRLPVSPSVNPGEILNPFILPYGMPYDSHHFDNIHNHQWFRSF